MRKGLILLLSILYITLTSGVAVNIHYCMGRMAGVSYGHETEHQCDKCGMEQRSGCCETESKLVKADNDHIFAKSVNAPVNAIELLPVVRYDLLSQIAPIVTSVRLDYHSPPDLRKNNLSIYNSVFRL